MTNTTREATKAAFAAKNARRKAERESLGDREYRRLRRLRSEIGGTFGSGTIEEYLAAQAKAAEAAMVEVRQA